MSEEIADAVRNCMERLERDDETFYSSIDMFENYFMNRSRFEKNEGFARILHELIFLRNLTRRSFSRRANEELARRINKRKQVISLASQIAAEQGAEEPTVEHRSLAEERIEESGELEESDPDVDRLKRDLDPDTISEMIDFENGAVNNRELSNYIEANFPDNGLLDSIATDSLQLVFTELDEEYKKDLKNNLLKELIDVAEGDENIEEKCKMLAETIRSEQLEYHRDARGWP